LSNIVEIAESWIGTPYQYGSMQKGKGVDCAKFVYAVCREAGVVPEGDPPPHMPPGWAQVPKTRVEYDNFSKQILRYGYKIPINERKPGDFVTFIYNGVESHIGVIAEDDCVIHAVSEKKVKKQRLSLKNVCNIYRANNG